LNAIIQRLIDEVLAQLILATSNLFGPALSIFFD